MSLSEWMPVLIPAALVLLLVAGVVDIVRPGLAFMLGQRWWFRDRPEPSDAFLAAARVGGVIAVVAALLLGALYGGLLAYCGGREAGRQTCAEVVAALEDVAVFDEDDMLTNEDEVVAHLDDLEVDADVRTAFGGEQLRVEGGDLASSTAVVSTTGGYCL